MHTNQALRAYGCAECTFLTCQGFERYCGGFPEKRKPKRFWKTDPQWKAPKWCPRRKTPAVYRVYHYKNDGSMLLSNALLHFDGKGMALLHLSATGTTLWLRRGRHSFRPGSF